MKPNPLFSLIPFFFVLGVACSIARDVIIAWDLEPVDEHFIYSDPQDGTTKTGLVYHVEHASIAPVNFTNILAITNALNHSTNLLKDGESVRAVVVKISNPATNQNHFFQVKRLDPSNGLASEPSRIIGIPAFTVALDNDLRILPPLPPIQP